MGKSLGGWGVWEERKQGEPPSDHVQKAGVSSCCFCSFLPNPPARLSRLRRFLFRSICPFSVPIFLSLPFPLGKGRERKYQMGTEKIGQDAKRKRRRPIWSLSWVSDKRNPRRWKTGPEGPGNRSYSLVMVGL